jgi:hypothetical protein
MRGYCSAKTALHRVYPEMAARPPLRHWMLKRAAHKSFVATCGQTPVCSNSVLGEQIREAFPWDARIPRFIVRDNDGAYGRIFKQRLYAMGIRDRPTTPHSPWQNGCAERLIGSIRRECLNHIVIGNTAHLRRVLKEYADYYNNDRTHLALDKDHRTDVKSKLKAGSSRGLFSADYTIAMNEDC